MSEQNNIFTAAEGVPTAQFELNPNSAAFLIAAMVQNAYTAKDSRDKARAEGREEDAQNDQSILDDSARGVEAILAAIGKEHGPLAALGLASEADEAWGLLVDELPSYAEQHDDGAREQASA